MEQLQGFSILEGADSVLVANTLRIWSTRHEAGYLIGPLDGTGPGEVYRTTNPAMIVQLRNMMDLMRDQAGLPAVPEVELGPHPLCPNCGGLGYWHDEDENEIDCAECLL
jgi:hypothetical protein